MGVDSAQGATAVVADDCCGGGGCSSEIKPTPPSKPAVCESDKGDDCCGGDSCDSKKESENGTEDLNVHEEKEGLLEDESIEEIYRPEPVKQAPGTSKKWRILDEDGLRNRGGGDGCCSSGGGCGPKTYIDETDEDRQDTKRRTWLSRFLLLMFLIPALPMAIVGWELFMSTQMAMTMGLVATPRERLEAFYRENNPGKLNEYTVQKLLRKWEGRYDQLFRVLEIKYAEKRAQRNKRSKRN